ncbi:MAG: SIMPL domain-containing protein [Pseudomonadota bacterium]
MTGCSRFQQAEIIVDGAATVTAPPDLFELYVQVEDQNEERLKLLSQISQTAEEIQSAISGISGLSIINMSSQSLLIETTVDPDCPLAAARYQARQLCPKNGFRGEIGITIVASPAESAGEVVSLAVERGAAGVRLSDWRLSDRAALEQRAVDAAIRDARRKAENLAKSTNVEIIGTKTIVYGEGLTDRGRTYERLRFEQSSRRTVANDEPFALETAPTESAAVSLSLKPPPFDVSASVTVAYMIKNKTANKTLPQ